MATFDAELLTHLQSFFDGEFKDKNGLSYRDWFESEVPKSLDFHLNRYRYMFEETMTELARQTGNWDLQSKELDLVDENFLLALQEEQGDFYERMVPIVNGYNHVQRITKASEDLFPKLEWAIESKDFSMLEEVPPLLNTLRKIEEIFIRGIAQEIYKLKHSLEGTFNPDGQEQLERLREEKVERQSFVKNMTVLYKDFARYKDFMPKNERAFTKAGKGLSTLDILPERFREKAFRG